RGWCPPTNTAPGGTPPPSPWRSAPPRRSAASWTGPTGARRENWPPPFSAPPPSPGRSGTSCAGCWTRWRCSMENIWMVLQQTAAATLTALFLLILQRIFLDKLSPRWQYGVWLVLLLRLLVPAGFGGRPTVLDVTFWVETLRTRVELGLNSAYSTPFAASLPAAPVPLPPAGAPTSWTDWAFLIYCAGVVLWAAWFVAGAVRLSLRVRGGVPVEGERRAAMEALAKQQRLPMPRRIVECRWARTPFVVGVVRPALVLPMGWA